MSYWIAFYETGQVAGMSKGNKRPSLLKRFWHALRYGVYWVEYQIK